MREEDLLERVGEIGAALRCDGDPDTCARSKTCPYHSGHVDHIGFGLGCDLERLERDAAEALEAMGARLAAYEDTGLEPEDCMAYSDVLELRMYRCIGSIPELRAMKEAQDERRVVALPCKVGDTAYWMWTDSEGNCEAPMHADRIYEIHITKDGVELSIQPYDGSIGKVGIHPPLAVFLTRAEAEAALRGGGDG